jgi:hypothetical protein
MLVKRILRGLEVGILVAEARVLEHRGQWTLWREMTCLGCRLEGGGDDKMMGCRWRWRRGNSRRGRCESWGCY